MDILFDLDDTLHDKTTSLKRCAQALYTRYSPYINGGRQTFSRRFVEEHCIIQPKPTVFELLRIEFEIDDKVAQTMLNEYDRSFHTYAQRFDGVMETLDIIAASHAKIGCVTNGRDGFQRNKIRALGLDRYLDVVVTSEELGIKKPHRRIFEVALSRLGAAPERTIFCGDSVSADIVPAKALGMTTVWKRSDHSKTSDVPDYQMVTYLEFPLIWKRIHLGWIVRDFQ
jgi:HAD superfamily hydrolase (TIGR01509 family)